MRPARLALSLVSTVVILMTWAAPAHALAGDLDVTFSDDGMTTTEFGGEDLGSAVAVQPDGKVVVAGSGGKSNFVVVRYNADGTLDTTFSSDGKTQVDFRATDEGAMDVAIAANGKIVVAGFTRRAATGLDFALMRFNANGTLDTTFSGDGKVATDFVKGQDVASAVAIQPNGRIVAGGYAFSPTYGTTFALARYYVNGNRDTSFSGDGRRMANYIAEQWAEAAYDIALQGDGKIVMAGAKTDDGVVTSILVARLTSAGNMDPAFSGDGWQIPSVHAGQTETAVLSSVKIRPDGRIIMGGFANSSQGGSQIAFLALQLLPAGQMDTGFSEDGWTQGFLSAFNSYGNDLVLQADGKALIVGAVVDPFDRVDMGVLRLNPDGTPDTTFGTNGEVVTTQFGGAVDTWYSAALGPDGKLVASGTTTAGGGDADIAAGRYLTE